MRRAVELAPQAYRFWLELGRMYEQTGENTLATDCYTKSLVTEPPLADLVFFKETKPRSNALERWQATLPSPEPSIYTQGWEAFSTGNFEESAVLFEQIASWRSTDVYLGLGLSYLHTDRLDEAKIALQKASFLSGENVRLSLRAHLGLHQVAVAQNDQQMAIQEGDVVLQIIEATTASGLGGINLNRVARMYFRRDALSPELLPGFIPIYGTQEVVAGLDQMGEFFEQNGQEHDVDRIEALKILAAPQY
jgi:tetratricopeptide (TPR) repeat protein